MVCLCAFGFVDVLMQSLDLSMFWGSLWIFLCFEAVIGFVYVLRYVLDLSMFRGSHWNIEVVSGFI